MLSIRMLPAKEGDALWITWGTAAAPHRMLIDMGTEGVGKKVRTRLLALPEAQRKLDLVVVTHVDRDHIGGVLTCLAEADEIPGLKIADVWFNGFVHLTGGKVVLAPGLEPLGPAQGERLSVWLRKQRWNLAFDGGPCGRTPGKPLKTVTLHDGLELTVIGPTPAKLESFVDEWEEEVHEALERGTLTEVSPGLEILGTDVKPELETKDDLEDLAATATANDSAKANGSSIALLLEYKGKSVVLAGDAHSDELIDGLQAARGNGRAAIDAFKLPHHASKSNVTRALVDKVQCPCWLVSTDGTRFKHPDPEAIARILAHGRPQSPLLAFNARSKFSGWWDDDDWKALFDYRAEYGSAADGYELRYD
jgi:metal-dependent hydrolase (beta-lactamase superfamily II)